MLVHYDTIGNVETGNVLPSVGLSWNDSLIWWLKIWPPEVSGDLWQPWLVVVWLEVEPLGGIVVSWRWKFLWLLGVSIQVLQRLTNLRARPWLLTVASKNLVCDILSLKAISYRKCIRKPVPKGWAPAFCSEPWRLGGIVDERLLVELRRWGLGWVCGVGGVGEGLRWARVEGLVTQVICEFCVELELPASSDKFCKLILWTTWVVLFCDVRIPLRSKENI